MTFQTLALVALVGVCGPLLATPRRWRLPLLVGELAAGVALGATGARVLHADEPTFAFLAQVGFALIMFVAGSHVPVRDRELRGALRTGCLRAIGVAAVAAVVGTGIARAFSIGHAGLYVVLLASSSAALVLPVVQSLHLDGTPVVQLLPQVALADIACIVALPLAVDPGHAGRAALGALAVIAAAVVVYVLLRRAESSGRRKRLHRLSEDRHWALELRISLTILFALAALAVRLHVSVLLAGFSFGVAIAAVGRPRRLSRQLFAITEGFLGPLFFVWLGSSLDLRQLAHHPRYVPLGLSLGVGAVITHAAMRVTGQPLRLAALAAGQLGVPVAAVTIGTTLGVLPAGEAAALLLGALVTIGVAAVAAGRAANATATGGRT